MDRRAFCAGGIPLKGLGRELFKYIEENGDKSSAVSDLRLSLKTAEPYRFIRKWALSLRLTTECGKLFYSPLVNFP